MNSEFINTTQAKQSCSLSDAGFRADGRGIGEGQYRLAGHDARNVKTQDLTQSTRESCLRLVAAILMETSKAYINPELLK